MSSILTIHRWSTRGERIVQYRWGIWVVVCVKYFSWVHSISAVDRIECQDIDQDRSGLTPCCCSHYQLVPSLGLSSSINKPPFASSSSSSLVYAMHNKDSAQLSLLSNLLNSACVCAFLFLATVATTKSRLLIIHICVLNSLLATHFILFLFCLSSTIWSSRTVCSCELLLCLSQLEEGLQLARIRRRLSM
jgi:hypothetical protein